MTFGLPQDFEYPDANPQTQNVTDAIASDATHDHMCAWRLEVPGGNGNAFKACRNGQSMCAGWQEPLSGIIGRNGDGCVSENDTSEQTDSAALFSPEGVNALFL